MLVEERMVPSTLESNNTPVTSPDSWCSWLVGQTSNLSSVCESLHDRDSSLQNRVRSASSSLDYHAIRLATFRSYQKIRKLSGREHVINHYFRQVVYWT